MLQVSVKHAMQDKKVCKYPETKPVQNENNENTYAFVGFM